MTSLPECSIITWSPIRTDPGRSLFFLQLPLRGNNWDNQMLDFISTAAAAEGAAQPQEGGLGSLLFIIIFFVIIFYFFLVRPQNKKAKEKQKLIDSIAVGSEVITVGGICGKVQKIKDEYLVIALGGGNTTLVINRGYVHSVLPKNTIDAIMSDAAVETPKKSGKPAEQKKGAADTASK